MTCANPDCHRPIPEDKKANATYCCWQCRDHAAYLRTRDKRAARKVA